MDMNKTVDTFLKEYSAKPIDNGFTERVMMQLPERSLWWKKIKWGDILQYACYTLAFILIVVSGGKELLNDILATPIDKAGFITTMFKDGLYIFLFAASIATFAVVNVIENER